MRRATIAAVAPLHDVVPHTEAPEHGDQAATRMRREIEVDDDAPLAPEEEDDQCWCLMPPPYTPSASSSPPR